MDGIGEVKLGEKSQAQKHKYLTFSLHMWKLDLKDKSMYKSMIFYT
jgi:hypothetical protein